MWWRTTGHSLLLFREKSYAITAPVGIQELEKNTTQLQRHQAWGLYCFHIFRYRAYPSNTTISFSNVCEKDIPWSQQNPFIRTERRGRKSKTRQKDGERSSIFSPTTSPINTVLTWVCTGSCLDTGDSNFVWKSPDSLENLSHLNVRVLTTGYLLAMFYMLPLY